MKKERVFWGVFFILGALFLIVGKLGAFEGVSIMKILISVFFVAGLIKSASHKSITGVLFSVAFLCIIWAKLLGIEAITPWPVLGAALLGSIGCSFLYHPKRNYSSRYYIDQEDVIETMEGAQMDFNTSFGGSIKYINSDDFQNASLRCSFGSMKVYFDNAVISKGEAVLLLDVSFSGVELYIPKNWNVVNYAEAAFGAIDEKNRSQSAGTPVLKIAGKVSFGGVEITYV